MQNASCATRITEFDCIAAFFRAYAENQPIPAHALTRLAVVAGVSRETDFELVANGDQLPEHVDLFKVCTHLGFSTFEIRHASFLVALAEARREFEKKFGARSRRHGRNVCAPAAAADHRESL